MKRIFSMFLSACLLTGALSGCAGSGGNGDGKGTGEVPMGRYVETQGETLEGVSQIHDFKGADDGSFTFFGHALLDDNSDTSAYKRYTAPADGGSITSEDVPHLSDFATLGVRDMSQGSDGTLYILYSVEGSYQPQAAKSLNGGAFEPIAVADLAPAAQDGDSITGSVSMTGGGSIPMAGSSADQGEAPAEDGSTDIVSEPGASFSFDESSFPSKTASGIRALDDGGFLILYGDKGASGYAADGTLRGEYTGNAYTAFATVLGSTMVLGSEEGTSLYSYDLSTGKQNGTYTYENTRFGLHTSLDAENLYLADATGIYRQSKGSTLWEKLVEGDLTSLAMPNLTISGFAPDGNGGFAALLGDQDGVQFMRYAYSATTPTNPDTELTIFSLNDNSTIRQTIGEFQRLNPNVRVNFRVGLDDGSAATTEDVVRTLNTEFLAGKGPDLLLLDGLPVDSYIDKGVLADLSGLLAEQTGLLSNLMGAYEKDGAVYGLPSRFTFPVMMGGADDVDNVDSLSALLARVREEQGDEVPFLRPSDDLWQEDGPGLLMDYYDVCAPSWLKDDGSIDETALAAYLSQMAELDRLMKEHTPQADGSVAFVTMAIASSGGAGGYETVNMGPMDLKSGLARFHTQEMAGVFAMSTVSQNLGDMDGQKLESLFRSGAYTPRGAVGLNAAGKQQELARSFVEMLLSRTVQDNYLFDGYPVNAESLAALVETTLDEGESDMGFLDLSRQLTTPLLTDRVIRDAVESQLKAMTVGDLTPEQAAAAVVENTRLYLAEQK